jgi:hypothetical protein
MRAMHLRRRAEDAEHATQGTTSRANPCLWLAGGVVLFFLVPLVGTDMLGLQPDLYRQRRRRWPAARWLLATGGALTLVVRRRRAAEPPGPFGP